MRPLRLLVSVSTSAVAVTLLLYLTLASPHQETSNAQAGRVQSLFSFTSPGSLFPPSAIISLTDDNSTFFLARPAAFGPDLPKHGLSGPLWIGSGFSDDAMGGAGELGCSDVPGWDDGDDGLSTADASKSNSVRSPGQADIQSIQEGAEIAGKVVLLKRGGCGFLAKVQWAQRRGGSAVIVGDDVRGGALVRMYAKGDVSNITIPSLFTSHTTAHLLSSLLPSSASAHTRKAHNAPQSGLERTNQKASGVVRSLKHSSGSPQEQPVSRGQDTVLHKATSHKSFPPDDVSPSLLRSFLSMMGLIGGEARVPNAGSRRIPSSGNRDWVQIDDWKDDQRPMQNSPVQSPSSSTRPADNFVIGKQDWRDPYLSPPSATTRATSDAAISTSSADQAGQGTLPGSGEYAHMDSTKAGSNSWLKAWFSSGAKGASTQSMHLRTRSGTSTTSADLTQVDPLSHVLVAHEGLWVTLIPTNVSTSPFFDTLLVLVVSPLVTLTVVYALLLLRSRIRRRRWRAPKSVVDRLPVRTYQTITSTSSSATPSASSPTTPLLQRSTSPSASSISPRRSRIDSDAPTASSALIYTTGDREGEKEESGLAAWRRRYGGRQKECVVCLDEYVDGVSQVMSLPCGHEFHADCITPWLVTRRRTCPICKGDVVRSLSQSYHDRLQSPQPTRSLLSYGDVDDVQIQAAETQNRSPSALEPVPMSTSAPAALSSLDDVENGWSGSGTRRSQGDMHPVGSVEADSSLQRMRSRVSTIIWRGLDVVGITNGSQEREPRPELVDRNR